MCRSAKGFETMALVFALLLVSVDASANLRSKGQPSAYGGYLSNKSPKDIADRRHEVGIKKGSFLAELYINCTVPLKDALFIEEVVKAKCGLKIKASNNQIAILDGQIKGASAADKKKDVHGESQYLKWIDQRENEEAEIKFYEQIIANGKIVEADAKEGLRKTEELRKKVQDEYDDLRRWYPSKDMCTVNSNKVLKEAKLLWKQYKDSSKAYSCGAPLVVDKAQKQCLDGDTKISIKCAVTCLLGYDDPIDSVNKLRCRKEGKFGKQLYGEWQGMASCIGRMCGMPRNISKAKKVGNMIRYPHSAHYTCYEGYSNDGTGAGLRSFHVPCDATGSFASNASHKCDRITCGGAPKVKNTKPIAGQFFFSDSITYDCLKGHTLDGTAGGLRQFKRTCEATGRFSAAQQCKPVRCGPAAAYDYSSFTHGHGNASSELFYADEVVYSCSLGYTLDQKAKGAANYKFTLVCDVQGDFTLKGAVGFVPVPQCKPVSAGMAPAVPFGDLKRRVMYYGESLVVTAHAGYSTTGIANKGISFLLTVTPQGTFAGHEDFKPVSCGKPPSVSKATTTFVGQDVVYKNFLPYNCRQGYSTDKTDQTAAKSFVLECQADGTLTRVPGLKECANIDDCASHTCGPFGSCVDHLMNYTCNCDSGYQQTWDNKTNELVCGNINDCGPEACGVGKCIDKVNSYSCNCPTGFKVIKPTPGETCAPKVCGVPPTIAHATTMPPEAAAKKAFYKNQVIYQCDHGHTMDGKPHGKNDFSIECQANKKFSTAGSCQPIKCGTPPKVNHSSSSPASAVFNESIVYKCEDGYTIDGTAEGHHSFSILCLLSGTYGDVSKCRPVSCGQPTDVPNSFTPAGVLVYMQKAYYNCLDGFSLNAKKNGPTKFHTVCQKDGTYGKTEQCHAKVCGNPLSKIHALNAAIADVGLVAYPMTAMIHCRDGYTVKGSPGGRTSFTVACLASGDFEADEAHDCQPVKCGKLPKLPNSTLQKVIWPNASKTHSQETINYGEKAIYTCGVGFTAGGEPEGKDEIYVECGPSGQLSIPADKEQCRNVNDCEQHTCGAKGKCIDLIGPTPSYTCDCDFGFSIQSKKNGEKSCGNTDDCKDQDCGVGVCKDLIGDYTCICPSGHYIGKKNNRKTCLPVMCKDKTPQLVNGKQRTRHSGPIFFPKTLHYECDKGYSVDGSALEAKSHFHVNCKPSGDLVGMLSCQRITCGTPLGLAYTALLYPSSPLKSIEYEEKVKYKCYDGYTVDASGNGAKKFDIVCQADGQLTVPKMCQAVKCGEAPVVANAHPSIAGNVFFAMRLLYHCLPGYTVDATPSAETHFARPCKKDGNFAALPSAKPCKPVSGGTAPTIKNAVMKRYAGKPVRNFPPQIEYPHGLEYECLPGFSETGSPSGPTVLSSRVNVLGQLAPALSTECKKITYNVRGQCKDSRNGQSLDGVKVRIDGSSNSATSNSGFFHLAGVGTGEVKLIYEKSEYIKVTKVIQVTGDIDAGGAADLSMSPKMKSDQWRAVVKWGRSPTDLDTYVTWGWSKVCWYRQQAESNGIAVTLEHDDTWMYGPETAYFSGMGNCRHDCDVTYSINDYTERGTMKSTDVSVTAYTGDSVAGTWKIKDCLSTVSDDGNWWEVFTVSAKTNKITWNCLQGPAPGGLDLHLRSPRNKTSGMALPQPQQRLPTAKQNSTASSNTREAAKARNETVRFVQLDSEILPAQVQAQHRAPVQLRSSARLHAR